MPFKGKIYISGPRMGTNNTTKELDLPFKKLKKTKKKRKR